MNKKFYKLVQNISVVLIIILIFRYAYIQLIKHPLYFKKSVTNYTAIEHIAPIRGLITDINGVVVADNQLIYEISINKSDFKKQIFEKLTKYIHLTPHQTKVFYSRLREAHKYHPVCIKRRLSDNEIAILTSHWYIFPKIKIMAHIERYYPFNKLYAHLVGYIGKISPKQHDKNYLQQSYIGKSGIELQYEKFLRGKEGKTYLKTDAKGNKIAIIKRQYSQDGDNVILSINHKLQQYAQSIMKHNGVIIAENPQNGEIITLVSQPSFNANNFINGITTEQWKPLINNPNHPLLNRAIQTTYAPASTLKPFIALTALYLGIVQTDTQLFDKGYFKIPHSNYKFIDTDYKHGLGYINMLTAITKSSDTYFYILAYMLGIDNIDKGLQIFGLNKKTNIDLPGGKIWHNTNTSMEIQ